MIRVWEREESPPVVQDSMNDEPWGCAVTYILTSVSHVALCRGAISMAQLHSPLGADRYGRRKSAA